MNLKGWKALILERFDPRAYLPMILVFGAANCLYANGTVDFPWGKFAAVLLLLLSFFFRLRLFDEIKDYKTDLKINPTRPLPRGVLSVKEVKIALAILIVFELLLSYALGLRVLEVHGVAIVYSLLMFKEFFIGDILRPHLTTYAVTHTFVSGLVGLSAMVAMLGDREIYPQAIWFLLMNWMFFNLFEFARKTFAVSEERQNVDSYSKIFGLRGALGLSVSQAVAGNIFLTLSTPEGIIGIPWLALIAYIIGIWPTKTRLNTKGIDRFRKISGVYLLVHYVLTIILLGM